MYRLENEKILFEKDITFEEKYPLLGFGSKSDVYKIKIGDKFYALKVFNDLWIGKLADYEQKLDINIYSYVSPKRIMYIDDKFAGYLMDYCRGKDLSQRKLNVTINEFAESCVKLIEDTYKLSLLKYNIYDTFISNLMYDGGFKMIDMDDYIYNKDKDIKYIDELNNRRLNQMLVNVFINSSGLASLFFENVEMTKLMASCNSGKITFEELFNTVCTKAFEIAGNELIDVKEVGIVLKKTKRF